MSAALPEPIVSPATVQLSTRAIEDLRDRLSRVRAPHLPRVDRWRLGTAPEVLSPILAAWAQFDVERLVKRLNAIPQVDVDLAGVRIRAFHLRGEPGDALPLVLTHGWPSTVLELLALADRLARPTAHGADAAQSFDVVVPALPGFPLSSAPRELSDYTAARTADRWAQLMAALGYDRFAASAGDIGARVTAWLAARHPERVVGIHVSSNALTLPPPGPHLSASETEWLARRAAWDRAQTAYVDVQQTKPLSLAHGLADSPAGLAAWIVEKWHGWSDVRGDLLDHFDADDLLGTLSLYWLTNSIATSLLPYHVYDWSPGARPASGQVRVPVNLYLAPAENGGIPPRALAERQYPVARWTELARGGHFVASEEPDLLAADIRAAFRGAR